MLVWLSLPQPVAAQGGPPPAPPVTFATPHAQRITNWDELIGWFEAAEQVDVRPRVSGFIENVHFKDGQIITRGDLLFIIDQRPYQLAVTVAQVDVARPGAQVLLAETEMERATALIKNLTITQRDVDTRSATLFSNRATQQASEANLKSAELNLESTLVRTPISGRISDKRIDTGNLVTGG